MEKEFEQKDIEIQRLKDEKGMFDKKIEDQTKTLKDEVEDLKEKLVQMSGETAMIDMLKKKVEKF